MQAHQVRGELPLPEPTEEQKAEMRAAIDRIGNTEFERRVIEAVTEWLEGEKGE